MDPPNRKVVKNCIIKPEPMTESVRGCNMQFENLSCFDVRQTSNDNRQ